MALFHFQIQVATDDGFSTITLDKSSLEDQTNFEYYNGSSWEALPLAGVSDTYAGKEIRYYGSGLPMSSGELYWRVRAIRCE